MNIVRVGGRRRRVVRRRCAPRRRAAAGRRRRGRRRRAGRRASMTIVGRPPGRPSSAGAVRAAGESGAGVAGARRSTAGVDRGAASAPSARPRRRPARRPPLAGSARRPRARLGRVAAGSASTPASAPRPSTAGSTGVVRRLAVGDRRLATSTLELGRRVEGRSLGRCRARAASAPAARRPRAGEVDRLQRRRVGVVGGERLAAARRAPRRDGEVVGRAASGARSAGRRARRRRRSRRLTSASSPNPTRRTSLRSTKPVASATRSRTSSITARTSAAEPPSAAWMKLACFSRHPAPCRCGSPRRPRPSIRLPALTSPGTGLTNTEPAVLAARLVLAAPAHDLGDRRLGRRRGRRARSCSRARRARPGASPRSEPRKRRPSSPAGHVARRRSPAARSNTSTSTRHAAMSEPCPPAFIRTAPPTEPGTPTAHSNPVSPAAAVRRASTGSAHRRRRRVTTASPSATSMVGAERRPTRHGDAGEAGVGDEQVRAAADDEHRQPGCRGEPRRRRAGRRACAARTNSAAGPPTR